MSLTQNVLVSSGSWENLQEVCLGPDAVRNEALLSRHWNKIKMDSRWVIFFPALWWTVSLSYYRDERTEQYDPLRGIVTATQTLIFLLSRGLPPFVLFHRWLALKPLKHCHLQLSEKLRPYHSSSLLLNQWSIHSRKIKIQNKYCCYSTYPGSIVSICWLYSLWDSALVNAVNAPFKTGQVRTDIILMKA